MDERLHQCGWLFRGFHSGRGGQATGRAARSGGGGGSAWSSLHLKSFRNLSRGKRK